MQCGSHHQLNYTFHSETFQNNFIDLSFPEPHTVYLEVSTTDHLKRLLSTAEVLLVFEIYYPLH